jgi:hypothetical protein
MSRKDNSFAELYDYIKKGMEGNYKHPNAFIHNFYTQFENRVEVLKGYTDNVAKLKARKNGNSFYHEIISVKVNPNITREKHYGALYNITSDYITMRANKCLVIGGIHDEHDHHIHMHLMISSNEVGKSKRFYLTTKEFSTVKKLCEEKALAFHPELAQKVLINSKKQINHTSNKEDALKRRTKKPSIKDQFKDKLKNIFDSSVDKADFFNNLESSKIEIYTRGKTIGFKDLENNRKHRLKTLGLESEFEKINNTLSQNEEKTPVDKAKTKNIKTAIKPKEKKPQKKPTNKARKTATDKEKTKPIDEVKYSIFTGFKDGFIKEWIHGDFSDREKRIKTEKTKKYRKSRKKITPDNKKTTTDKIKETANRWVFGNFEDEQARSRMKNWKDKHDKEQVEIKNTKSREDQTTTENIIETAKEWIKGDFTARENRIKKAQQEKEQAEWYKSQQAKQAEITEQSKKSEKSKPKTKPQVKTTDKQKRRETISKVRKSVDDSKSKNKDLGKSL